MLIEVMNPDEIKMTLHEIHQRKLMGPLRSGLDYIRLEVCGLLPFFFTL
jgi:hypothetical protein